MSYLIKIFILINLTFISSSAFAWAQSEKEIVQKFLSSKESKEFREGTKPQGSTLSDLDGDGKPELILVWTTVGPTYWHNNLTVLSELGGEYKLAGSIQLVGEAKLLSAQDGIIFVDQVVYADKDPLCCPTVHKEIQYRWSKSGVFQVSEQKQ